MKILKSFIVITILFISIKATAEGIDRGTTASMIDKMVAKGILGKDEAQQAKAKLAAMPDQEWSQLNSMAKQLAKEHLNNKNVEASVDSAVTNINFDSEEFKKIQSKVKDAMSGQ